MVLEYNSHKPFTQQNCFDIIGHFEFVCDWYKVVARMFTL